MWAFREHRCSETRPFLKGLNEHSPFLLQFLLPICVQLRSVYVEMYSCGQYGRASNWSHVQLCTCSVAHMCFVQCRNYSFFCRYSWRQFKDPSRSAMCLYIWRDITLTLRWPYGDLISSRGNNIVHSMSMQRTLFVVQRLPKETQYSILWVLNVRCRVQIVCQLSLS